MEKWATMRSRRKVKEKYNSNEWNQNSYITLLLYIPIFIVYEDGTCVESCSIFISIL